MYGIIIEIRRSILVCVTDSKNWVPVVIQFFMFFSFFSEIFSSESFFLANPDSKQGLFFVFFEEKKGGLAGQPNFFSQGCQI